MKRRIGLRGAAIVPLVAFGLVSSSCRTRHAGPSCSSSFEAVADAARYLIASDNARNVDAVLAGYTDDVVWIPPTGEIVRGKAAIRARYEQLFSGFKINMSSSVVEARADGTLGFARGLTKGTLTPTADGAPVLVHDRFLALVRCERGSWRVSHLMWSPVSSGK